MTMVYQEYKVYAGTMYCGRLTVISNTMPNVVCAHGFEDVSGRYTLERNWHNKVAGYKRLRLVRVN